MVMSKEEFFEEGKLTTERVPFGKGEVIVSEISAFDYNEICELSKKDGSEDEVDMRKFTPTLLAFAIVDENGNRMFTNEDIPQLSKLGQKAFLVLGGAAKRLNGLAGDEVKNSEAIPVDSLTGESQLDLDIDTQTN